MQRDKVILVNKQDEPIGTANKLEAHEKAQLHRAFSVFVLRKHQDNIEALLQQRNPNKYHCGGLWTNTCCSHPQPNEATISAGEARLMEEMGFTTPLKYVGHFIYQAPFDNGLTEHELDHVLVGWYDGHVDLFNREEVAAVHWMGLSALQDELTAQPDTFTPWLKPALELLLENQTNLIGTANK